MPPPVRGHLIISKITPECGWREVSVTPALASIEGQLTGEPHRRAIHSRPAIEKPHASRR